MSFVLSVLSILVQAIKKLKHYAIIKLMLPVQYFRGNLNASKHQVLYKNASFIIVNKMCDTMINSNDSKKVIYYNICVNTC